MKNNSADSMTQTTGNDHPKVISLINQAIQLSKDGHVPLAIDLLTILAQEFPNASGVHGYLGWFFLTEGKSEEALRHSELAVELAPNSEKASLVYFHSLWRNGQYIAALDEMKRYLLIRPSEEYIKIINEWSPTKML